MFCNVFDFLWRRRETTLKNTSAAGPDVEKHRKSRLHTTFDSRLAITGRKRRKHQSSLSSILFISIAGKCLMGKLRSHRNIRIVGVWHTNVAM